MNKLKRMYRKHSKKFGLTKEQLMYIDHTIINGVCTNYDNELGKILEEVNKFDDTGKDI